jgi:hypothetical protein
MAQAGDTSPDREVGYEDYMFLKDLVNDHAGKIAELNDELAVRRQQLSEREKELAEREKQLNGTEQRLSYAEQQLRKETRENYEIKKVCTSMSEQIRQLKGVTMRRRPPQQHVAHDANENGEYDTDRSVWMPEPAGMWSTPAPTAANAQQVVPNYPVFDLSNIPVGANVTQRSNVPGPEQLATQVGQLNMNSNGFGGALDMAQLGDALAAITNASGNHINSAPVLNANTAAASNVQQHGDWERKKNTPGLKIPKFTYNGDISLFLERMELYFDSARVADDEKTKIVLGALDDLSLNAVIKEKQVGRTFPDYQALKTYLNQRFRSIETGCAARLNFRTSKQKPGQTPDDYLTTLLGLAKDGYDDLPGNTISQLVKEKFIEGLEDSAIRIKALEKDPKTIEDALALVKTLVKLKSYSEALDGVKSSAEGLKKNQQC